MSSTKTSDTMQRMDALKDSVRDFVHSGQDKAGDLKDKAFDIKEQAFDAGAQALTRTREVIKLHPIASVAVAFGIGYIVMRVARLV
jgi:ElaB/YqjD/DUF883 family membrane-anchored ribosome-binding protein